MSESEGEDMPDLVSSDDSSDSDSSDESEADFGAAGPYAAAAAAAVAKQRRFTTRVAQQKDMASIMLATASVLANAAPTQRAVRPPRGAWEQDARALASACGCDAAHLIAFVERAQV